MLRTATISLCMMAACSASAATPTGSEIIQKSLQNASGISDMTQSLKMVLLDKAGNSTEREMQIKALTDKQGNKYSMSVFTAPRREKGISLLTVAKNDNAGTQYIYLPSSRRVKRVTSSNKASSFRGSEFTFEDLGGQNPQDYSFKTLRQEPCGEQQCFVVERTPKTGDSSYSKTNLWFDTDHYRPIKAVFYDKAGKELKTMSAVNYRHIDNKYWSPEQVIMANTQTGKSTKMVSLELKTNTGLKPKEFTELAMRNWR